MLYVGLRITGMINSIHILSVSGPDSWWVHYPAASGLHQSPVDIDPETAEFDSDLVTYPLKIYYPDEVIKLMYNTGHSCRININSKNCGMYIIIICTPKLLFTGDRLFNLFHKESIFVEFH